MSGSELTAKLEPAFLAGLRCSQPAVRQKFMAVFDGSIKKRLYDRLLYITCSQNWEAMACHFWIKQCIEVSAVTSFRTRRTRDDTMAYPLWIAKFMEVCMLRPTAIIRFSMASIELCVSVLQSSCVTLLL